MSYLSVQQIFKTYPTPTERLPVLKGVNLSLKPGDFAALVGAPGSGKTTLLNQITGIDQPDSGEVQIDDVKLTSAAKGSLVKWRARNIGIVFQFFQLLPTLTVLQNVVAPMDFASVYAASERRARAMYWLERLGIADQAMKTPDMLSGGQQQRVAIARALANDPPLIIGDELTANLDRMSASNVFQILHELADKGRTVLVISYDRELVKSVPLLLELHEGQVQPTTIAQLTKHRTQELAALHHQTLTRGS